MKTSAPIALLLLLATALPAMAQAGDPYITWISSSQALDEGFPVEATIHLESSLGAHELKWTDIASMSGREGTVRVWLADGSELSGTLRESSLRIERRDGSKADLSVKELQTVTMSRAIRVVKGPPPVPRVKPLARGASAFRCGGLTMGEGETVVALDRGSPAVVFFDGNTLAEKSRSKLGVEARTWSRVPGVLQAVAIVPGGLAWIDLKTGTVIQTIKVGSEFLSLAAISADLAAASDGKTLAVISRKTGGVLDRLERSGPDVGAAPAPDMLLTSDGLYWIDAEANGTAHLVISKARTPSFTGATHAFLSTDGRHAIEAAGIVSRLGRGAGAYVNLVARTAENVTGYFSQDSKRAYLFTPDLHLVVFETSTWKELRRIETGIFAWCALPMDGGKAAVLLGTLEADRDRYPGSHFMNASPGELLKISVEE